MNWQHGYAAERGYTFDFHSYTSPAKMAWVAALKGYRCEIERFRYLDLGCGQGLSVVHLAALSPNSDFIAIDFMPEHIAHGRSLAKSAGLKNIQFFEVDFLELSKTPLLFGEFNYIVAHGITTWVSPDIRESVFKIVSHALLPGGLMYNSYNTLPGWLEMMPYQHLVSQLAENSDSKSNIPLASKLFIEMKKANSPLFDHFPLLEPRVKKLAGYNESYLAHEYKNSFWSPVFSEQMLRTAVKYKLSFLGQANPVELFDEFIPVDLLKLFSTIENIYLRETIRDCSLATNFRMDIYVKGGLQNWVLDNDEVVLSQRYTATALKPLPPVGEPFIVKTGSLDIRGEQSVYGPILESFGFAGNTLLEVLSRNKKWSKYELTRAISVLIQGGWLELQGCNDPTEAVKLNMATTNSVLKGAPYKYLCLPGIGTSIKISSLDMMMIGMINQGVSLVKLEEALIALLTSMNMTLTGKAAGQESLTDHEFIAGEVKSFLESRRPNYIRLGAIEDPSER